MPALPKLKEVLITLHRNGILELRLNTPATLNSFGPEKFVCRDRRELTEFPVAVLCAGISHPDYELIEGFKYAKENDNVKAVVVSANGRFFSSGAALSKDRMVGSGSSPTKNSAALDYIDTLIDFPKLAVCALNGPAYGIAVTTLPLFDLVYGSPSVTLTTPFSRIGIALEGCSSITFPPIFGPSMTTRILYLAETVPISELMYSGFFAEVLPAEGIAEAVIAKLENQLEDLALGSIRVSKSQVRSPEIRANLHKVNHTEMAAVAERVVSQEHQESLKRFQDRKAAKKAAQSKL